MLIKALIVDDEKGARDILRKLLQRYCPDVAIIGEASSSAEAYSLIIEQHPQLVFLDVEMPYATGFDLLNQVPNIDFEVVFVTGFDRYALNAIKFSALDYLLKPVSEVELIQAVHKAKNEIAQKSINERFSNFINNMQNESQQKIGIPTMEGFIFIDIDEIIRCEADSRCTYLFTTGGKKILATRNLREFDDILNARNFFRSHHSHLVNLKYIEKFYKGDGSYILMSDGTQVNVSRRRKDDLLQKLNTL